MLITMERYGKPMTAKQKANLRELPTAVKAPHGQTIPQKLKSRPVV